MSFALNPAKASGTIDDRPLIGDTGMPVVFTHQNLKFFFYSNEGNPREPIHVHVRGSGAIAKIWLHPLIGIAESRGFNSRELSAILRLVIDNRHLIEKTWHDYFGN